VSASQIGQYAYCARSWWLSTVDGTAPIDPRLVAQGTRRHERHGWRVALARAVHRLALWLLAAAALAFLSWGLYVLARR
jgi:hypothetical protein